MPPSAGSQKTLVNQFTELTGGSDRQAQRFLRAVGWRISEAVDAYYSSSQEAKGPSPLEQKLSSRFDSLRDASDEDPDKLDLESTMGYLGQTLGVSIENAELFVALELLQAPSVGEISREGFVNGWKVTGVGDKPSDHSKYLQTRIKSLASDVTLFKKVYKYVFIVGKERDQKALSLENAVIYWSMIFAPPGMQWKTAKHDWLELYKTFLSEKWTRSVNRDMWNMTLEFAVRSMDDETLSFWNEDGAWPSVIDDFVEWCRTKDIGKGETMDVDN